MSRKIDITVVLNAYKRLDNLSLQIKAINSQTIKPKEILIWQNLGNLDIPEEIFKEAYVAVNNKNYGVWARFAFALNAKTEYVCVFDDDTIPGKKWFENCINTMEQFEGLLGTRGIKFKSRRRYAPNYTFGWDNPNDNVEKVDFLGHSWFFKREWLAAFWRELPPINASNIAGEDIHFSYALQKYLGLGTYVPPHPMNDSELWGNDPKLALLWGNDEHAISKKDDSIAKFNKAFKYYIERGYIICDENDSSIKKEIILGRGLSSIVFLKRILKKNIYIYKLVQKLNNRLKSIGIYL